MISRSDKILDLSSKKEDRKRSADKKAKREKMDVGRVIFCIMCFLIIAWSLSSIVIQEFKLSKIKKQQAAYETQIESLKQEVSKLQDEKAKSQSLDYVEKVAREKLKMVKPNEVIYYINSGSGKPK